MAALTIRNIDDSVKTTLRMQAAQHGCSMEEEARRILSHALLGGEAISTELPLGTRLRQHFTGMGDIALAPRRVARAAPDFTLEKSTLTAKKPKRK
jgi:antitoxin FitA